MNETDPRYQKSRMAIIDSAISVLLANPNAGMVEVASAAAVGRATLYRHFESKEKLIAELTMICLEETNQLLQPVDEAGLDGLEAILACIDILVPLGNKYRFLTHLYSVIDDDAGISAEYQRQLDGLLQLVDGAKRNGEIRDDLASTWIVASFDALIYAAWDSYSKGEATFDELTESVKKTLVGGVKA